MGHHHHGDDGGESEGDDDDDEEAMDSWTVGTTFRLVYRVFTVQNPFPGIFEMVGL